MDKNSTQDGTLDFNNESAAFDYRDSLKRELAEVLNRHSVENASDTPDYILAEYLVSCLDTWNHTAAQRAYWIGEKQRPSV